MKVKHSTSLNTPRVLNGAANSYFYILKPAVGRVELLCGLVWLISIQTVIDLGLLEDSCRFADAIVVCVNTCGRGPK